MTIPAVSDATWDATVLERHGPVIVVLGADRSTPCAGYASVVRRLSEEYPAVSLLQLDVDTDPRTARRYGVTSLPTLLLFRDGALVLRLVGARQPERLRDELAGHLY